MENEVIGVVKNVSNNLIVIVDDEGDEIEMEGFLFSHEINKFIGKRVSFYYNENGNWIDEVDNDVKANCLCYNHIQGNYYLSQFRISRIL